jgi:hypothetical protein
VRDRVGVRVRLRVRVRVRVRVGHNRRAFSILRQKDRDTDKGGTGHD